MNASSQADRHRCRVCGASLDRNPASDLCPGCALESALEPQAAPDTVLLAANSSGKNPAPTPRSLLGRFGDYELLEEIARGGMGVVFKARQLSLDRLVAIKMLLFGPLASTADVQRFRTEAAAAASLQHPNIVAIHEVGFRDGHHFLVMDYVPGRTLAEIVKDGPLPAEKAATYVKTIAEAIHYAHGRGILHRDLKPSNILLDSFDQPRVTDFGLAKRLADSSGSALSSQLTLSGQVMGSPSYMAPEQAAAHRGAIGIRTDVYALGALLYHLLTGRAPFAAPTLGETLEQVQNAEPISPTVISPDLPRDLKTICLKCLQKQASRRYETAQAVAGDLGRFLNSQTILARPAGQTEKLWRWCRRKPLVASLATATVLTILFGFGGVTWQGHRASEARDVAERRLYAAQMRQAFSAWEVGNLKVARALLEASRSQPQGAELRGADWRWLWSLCQSEWKMELPTQGEWQICAIEPSPDGQRFAATGWNSDFAIYDFADLGKPLVMRGHTRKLMGSRPVAFSPDGRRLASASGGAYVDPGPCELFLWDLVSTNKIVLEGHDAWLWAVVFSPDGALLASACLDGTVGLWDAQTGRNLAILRGHRKPAYTLAFSPDNKWLLSGGEDGTIRRWDVAIRREIAPPLQHELPVYGVAVAPDGSRIAAACTDNYLRVWDATSWRVSKLRYNLPERVSAPVFSPDGRLLAFGTGNNIRLWDLEIVQEKTVLRGSSGAITCLQFLPNGQGLVSASWFEHPLLWDLNRPEKVPSLRGFSEGIRCMSVASGARLVAIGSGDAMETRRPGEVMVFDLAAQQPLLPPLKHPQGLNSVSLPDNGKLLATGCPDGSVRIFSLPEGQLLRTMTNIVEHKRGNLVFSPDAARLVACGGKPTRLIMWNTATWQAKCLLRNAAGGPQNFAFSPDGCLLATPMGSEMCTIIWNMSAGTTNIVIPSSVHARGAAFSPDGAVLAVHTFFDIELFEVKTWAHLGTLKGHEHVVNGIAFAPDGKILASAGVESSVRLWSVPARAEVAVLYDHLDSTETVAFTADGQWLISGSGDKTVKLRHIPSFDEIGAVERAASTRP